MKRFATCFGIALAMSATLATAQSVMSLCGGIGADERRMMEEARKDAKLELLFVTAKRGGYVAGAKVTITRDGKPVTSFDADGPMCAVNLPAGNYRVEARIGESSSAKNVKIPATGHAPRAVFTFPDEPSDGIEASEEEKAQARRP